MMQIGLETKAAIAALALALSLGAGAASAAVVSDTTFDSGNGFTHTGSGSGNDCAGSLGKPPDCVLNGSPMIGKVDMQSDGTLKWTDGVFGDLSALFQINLDFTGSGWANAGTFTYMPGPDDPGITGFTVKGGPGYNIFTTADPVFIGQGAMDVSFFAPDNPGGNPAGVSHIVFFDSTVIPLPAAGWLLLSGLGALGIAGYRRRRQDA